MNEGTHGYIKLPALNSRGIVFAPHHNLGDFTDIIEWGSFLICPYLEEIEIYKYGKYVATLVKELVEEQAALMGPFPFTHIACSFCC